MNSWKDSSDGPRGCGPNELAPTLDLMNRVMRIELGNLNPTIGADYPHVYREANRENMRILKVDGQVVCHLGMFITESKVGSSYLRIASLGCMATHPDFRHRGYGAMVIRDYLARLTQLEADVGWLGTDIDDWYRRTGWERAGREYVFTLDRGNIHLLPPIDDFKLESGHLGRIEQLTKLHHEHPAGTKRTSDLFQMLLERPSTGRWPRIQTFTAIKGNDVVAYAVLTGQEIIEHAGPPAVVAALVREIFQTQDDRSVSTSDRADGGAPLLSANLAIHAPAISGDLAVSLLRLGIPHSLGHLGMFVMPDPLRTLGRLGYDDVKVRQEDGRAVLTRGGKECNLTPAEQIKLILGPEKASDFADDLFPIDFYHWPLDYI